LIIQNQLDENGKIMLDTNGQPLRQWMVNFGGDATTNYQSGIQIPFYVIAFGLIGGYLRYLIKTFRRGGGDTGIDHQKALFDDLKEVNKRKAELREEEFHRLEKTQFGRETLSVYYTKEQHPISIL
jgi:hypothetical protein